MGRIITWFKRINYAIILVAVVAVCLCGVAVFQLQAAEHDAGPAMAAAPAGHEDATARVTIYAFMTAAIATGMGSIAAGIAVSLVGAAAMGAVVERPELMGRSLIYVALAEGIAIYGLLIAIIILAKV